jgi:quinol monooxygenase YgiN
MAIIVAGRLRLKPNRRDEFIQQTIPSISLARANKNCLDFSVSADPIDQNRVNIYEHWLNRSALEAFRNSGPENDYFSLVLCFEVSEYDI